MRLIARISTGLSIVLLVACCGVWLLLSAPRAGFEALTIPTSSMYPTMPAGSLALVRQVPVSGLHTGDIITYADPFNPHKTITHRIIKTYLIANAVPGFMTKGDANSSPDLPIPGGSVQGKVVWHVPYVGAALSWARSWAGIAVLVYLPALLVMIEEIKRLRDYYRLSLPYRLAGYRYRRSSQLPLLKPVLVGSASVAVAGVFAWQPIASALFASNAAVLAGNRISVAMPAHTIECRSNSNISVNTNSSQTAVSGAASSNGSTDSTGQVSAQTSNSSSTNVHIDVNSGC